MSNEQREKQIMSAAEKYADLLQCKQRLEEIIQERIHQLDSQIAMMKYQQQVNDAIPAIGRYTEPLEEEFVSLSAEINADKYRHFVGVDTGEGSDKTGFIEMQNSKPS